MHVVALTATLRSGRSRSVFAAPRCRRTSQSRCTPLVHNRLVRAMMIPTHVKGGYFAIGIALFLGLAGCTAGKGWDDGSGDATLIAPRVRVGFAQAGGPTQHCSATLRYWFEVQEVTPAVPDTLDKSTTCGTPRSLNSTGVSATWNTSPIAIALRSRVLPRTLSTSPRECRTAWSAPIRLLDSRAIRSVQELRHT